MSDCILLALVKENKKVVDVSIELGTDHNQSSLKVFGFEPLEAKKYQSYDYFYALRDFRLDLEKYGLLIACKGCLNNVYPSGMSAEMSQGLSAYEAVTDNPDSFVIVDIFDVVGGENFKNLTTVYSQKEYRRELINRVRQRI